MKAAARVRRWPLILIASPAAVSIWSGWVGIGGLAGFGPVHPLPGIAPGFVINTAITLPIGVEAYGAYALGAWLAPTGPTEARRFARRSAVGALVLGMAGQVIYHLLAAARATTAPWPVTVLVSCMPVVTLGFGAALTHLLRNGPATTTSAHTIAQPQAGEPPDTGIAVDSSEPAHAGTRELASASGESGDRPALPPARADTPKAGIDRTVLVAELAGQIRAAAAQGQLWRPDYPALMARTGYSRSWCEKAVRAARDTAAAPVRGATVAAVPGPRTGSLVLADARTEPGAA